MTLLEKQFLFSKLLRVLLGYIDSIKLDVTLGEAWRSTETARIYAIEQKGVPNSLHTLRLAIDLNLFKDGVYLSTNEDYKMVGQFWESLSKAGEYNCVWGGRFGDSDHFSIEHQGRQ